MKTKKYWQAVDKDGAMFLYNERPTLKHGSFQCTKDGDCTSVMLFPIPLKPLQIAEITVCENGTWSYEIERENEGYYSVMYSDGSVSVWRYVAGDWYIGCTTKKALPTPLKYTISQTRIPDECII